MTNKTAFTGTITLLEDKLGVVNSNNEFVAAEKGDMISFYDNATQITPIMTVEAKPSKNAKELIFADILMGASTIGIRSGETLASTFGKGTHQATLLKALTV